MDGYESTKKIRIDESKYLKEQEKKSFIVALTAHNTKDFKEKCFISGMDQFIAKPVEITRLKEVLQEVKLIW